MTPGSNDNFINFIFKETKDDAPDKQLAKSESTLDRLLLYMSATETLSLQPASLIIWSSSPNTSTLLL